MKESWQSIPFWRFVVYPGNRFTAGAGFGDDEWHNASVWISVPVLGQVAFFYGRAFSRDGVEHVWAITNGEVSAGVPRWWCQECSDFMADV